jgi:hypothetical protein
LALYLAYELHYRGFAGVEPAKEWDLEVLARRRTLENLFRDALRAGIGRPGSADALDVEIEALLQPPGESGPSYQLLHAPDIERLREIVVHRSLYHLKEADPQAWVLPRLEGAAKTLVAAVEFDEYGGGRPDRSHAELFAAMMRCLDLDDSYGAYLDVVPAPMLAVVNLMSMCGLHRELRGALLGQLAVVELTSPLTSRRMVDVARAHGCGAEVEAFYAEHVVADVVHERTMRDALAATVADEPALAADIVFGMRAAQMLDSRLDAHLMTCWGAGRSSLRSAPPGTAP